MQSRKWHSIGFLRKTSRYNFFCLIVCFAEEKIVQIKWNGGCVWGRQDDSCLEFGLKFENIHVIIPQQGRSFSWGQAATGIHSPSSCHMALGCVQIKDQQTMLFPGWPCGHSFIKSSNPGVQQILHCYGELQQVQVQPSHFMWVNRNKVPGLLWLCEVYLMLHPGLQGRMVPVPCYTCTCALLEPQRSGVPGGHDAFGVKHLFLCSTTPGPIGLNVECCIWACPLPGSHLLQASIFSPYKTLVLSPQIQHIAQFDSSPLLHSSEFPPGSQAFWQLWQPPT